MSTVQDRPEPGPAAVRPSANGTGSGAPAVFGPGPLVPRRRSWKPAAVGVVVVGALAAGGGVYLSKRSSDHASATTVAPLSTTEVAQRDLTIYDETTATLEYTASATVSSPVAGTVTSVVSAGDTITAGTVVATIDGSPVVALFGDVPPYRDLSTSSTDGIDVRQLETNLVSLGFDPTGDIVIDENYDSATKAAVERWQTALGIKVTGKVPESLVTYIPGSLLVDKVSATVGAASSAGSALVSGRQTERAFPVVAYAGDNATTIGGDAAPGTQVVTGTVLFHRDGLPVVAIVGDASAVPALDRDLKVGSSAGADVKLLEQMLQAGGFDPDNAMVIDDEFDAATATAVLRWWQSLGVPYSDPAVIPPKDVVVPTGSFVVVPSGLQVGAPELADGAAITSDAVALTLTSPARVVSTTAPLGDKTFALGAQIEVVFPDGTSQTGTVTGVGDTATSSGNTPGQTPNVPIQISVATIPDSAASYVQIPVTLRAVTDQAKAAFVVPVSALVALAEGGYAIETVTGTGADGTQTTGLIGVTTGLFSDGFVQVTGDGLSAGLKIVVPS